ncbi:hypothetical protein LTR10_018720 [Elasticomyces elasticus]|uniref:Exo-alpha-sialidase n=1 Tax=Exophiala sideris TaxID=1016849 RepID=A0ABR0JAM6_9EURO|nr:hypothetical protein LTR10_018720 [Elasticomyces elasticus]KAK5026243.1 hypothetical protein LTS07_007768 [Exophiala sideris]KAK5032496.1 hypothetical protein LTR13_007319 [Exophiala sideris]KAK5059655.1 hypothetical protein LTR69_006244 [Exophiala sideris]KAK5178061.1 hypothetical protein LTR44_009367 [Eurotiomycetes sp. CCFEE 6388]
MFPFFEGLSTAIDWKAAIEKYDVVAQKFAPIVTFYRDGDQGSDERCYPCSIEWLLPQTSLKKNRVSYTLWNTNSGHPPSVAWFNNSFHMFFQDQGNYVDGGIMHVKSQDAWEWANSDGDFYTGHNCSDPPHVITFQDKLHLFWRDGGGNGMMHRYSTDGQNWSNPQYLGINIDNQPHGVVWGNELFVVAVDHSGNGIMFVSTTDGENFTTGYTGYNTNNGTPMSVVAFDNALHLFFQDHNGQTIMHLVSTDGKQWDRPASWNTGLYTSNGPTAVVHNGALHLFFKDASGYAIFHSVSTTDSDHFSKPQAIGLDCDGQPQALSVGDTLYVSTVDSRGQNGIMLAVISSFTGIQGPQQSDLATYADSNYFLEVQPSAYSGQPLENGKVTAPIYYTVQEQAAAGYVDITYMMIYGNQAGQPAHALRAGTEFNCILESYGDHQGDLEWLVVRLSPDLETIRGVGYEAHGEVTWYNPGAYQTEGQRPIVRASRCGHGCRNGLGKNPIDWIDLGGQSGAAEVIDLFSQSGNEWRPFDLNDGVRAIGLDSAGQPINDQVWAKYRGRLGRQNHNNLESATYVNGNNLSTWDWDFVKTVDWAAGLLNKISSDVVDGIGPEGPGARDFITWKIDA